MKQKNLDTYNRCNNEVTNKTNHNYDDIRRLH